MRFHRLFVVLTALLLISLIGCESQPRSRTIIIRGSSTPPPPPGEPLPPPPPESAEQPPPPSAAEQPGGTAEQSENPPATPSQEQPEALTRGPVSESFAEPVDTQVQDAGVVASTQPPEPVQETPPSEKPEGGRYVWVPGYWAWDADRKGYIWVSGCWRAAPPRMSWVPGYWAQADGGWQWVAGFWAPADSQEMTYLPAPPADVDAAPPGPPPTPDQVWVPPCYYWDQGGYVLRPGYWLVARNGWCWSPTHYVWTPRGYVFAAGYWDYSLERRGVLFAPVFFGTRHFRAGFVFSPSITLDVGALSVNFFAYPRYHHYYFGDYYDSGYVTLGIYPWFECERFHTWYDPIFVYDRWHFGRGDPHWIDHVHHDYEARRADPRLRPAHTYREQEARLARLPAAERGHERIGQPLREVVANKSSTMKYEKIDKQTRQSIAHQTADANKFRQDRSQWESQRSTARPNAAAVSDHRDTTSGKGSAGASHNVREAQPDRVKTPTSPIAGRSEGADRGDDKDVPERPEREKSRRTQTKDRRGKDDNKKN